jgi:hypothetical protein
MWPKQIRPHKGKTMRTPQAMTPDEKTSLQQMVTLLSQDFVSQKKDISGAKIQVCAGREGLECTVHTCVKTHGWTAWDHNPHTVDNTSLRHAILAALDAGACLLQAEDVAGHHESLAAHPKAGPITLFTVEADGEISSHMKLKALAIKTQLRDWAKASPINPAGIEYYLEGLA